MARGNSLAINALYNVIYKLLNILFPLITTIYASRILDAEGIGKVSYAQNIAQYFIIAAGLGIPIYGIRQVSNSRENQVKLDRVFSELFIINACSTILCVVIYYAMILYIDFFAKYRLLLMATGLSLILNLINVDWFYQGEEEFGYIAKRNFAVKTVALIFLFSLVRTKDDYIIYAIINSLAVAGNNIFNVFMLRGKVNLSLKELSIARHFKPVLLLLASTIAIELYTLLDTTMLGALCHENIVGYYNNAVKVARGLNMGLTAMIAVLLPRFSYYLSVHNKAALESIAKKALRMLILISAPAATELCIFADDIIILCFGNSFAPAVESLRFLSVLVIAVSLNNFFGTQILLTFGQENKLLIAVVCGALVNIIFNAVLIPVYLNNGAAFASAVSEICVAVVTYIFARKYVAFYAGWHFWASIATSLLALILTASVVRWAGIGMAAELVFGLMLSLIVYGGCAYALRNQEACELIDAFGKFVRSGEA